METITGREFDALAGVEDWRALAWGVCACFRTGSFVRGAEFVAAIAAVADAAGHHPDVDLRSSEVTLRLFSVAAPGLTQKDIGLAQAISGIARELGLSADPSAVQSVQVSVTTTDPGRIMDFWKTALDYDILGETELIDPHRRNPVVWFHQVDRPVRNRMHLDVTVGHELAEARVAAIVGAGGKLLNDSHAPKWWTLEDADGHKLDIETWPGSY